MLQRLGQQLQRTYCTAARGAVEVVTAPDPMGTPVQALAALIGGSFKTMDLHMFMLHVSYVCGMFNVCRCVCMCCTCLCLITVYALLFACLHALSNIIHSCLLFGST